MLRRSRQFTVFVPAEAQEKKAALVEQLNKMSRFTGLTAVDGGTNVVNVILQEADKGRIIDYLRCRGDIPPAYGP